MGEQYIIDVTGRKVPSILGLNNDTNIVIGEEARKFGIEGRTNTYHFKPKLGSQLDETIYEAKKDKAGRHRAGQPKPYWLRSPSDKETQFLTELEAATLFLRQLLPVATGGNEKIIVGEPALDENWKENYRRNINKILTDLGYAEPIFSPEPFAVYQYFRKIEGKIPQIDRAQTILVVDFGGGTFNCCVIRTNKQI